MEDRKRPRRPQRRATYEDLLKVPDHLVAEIVDGVLYTWPRPAVPHASVSTILASHLLPPFQEGRGGPGGWFVCCEPELHLAKDTVVPDIAGWRIERMPYASGAYATIAPDWICEVLSPSTRAFDRGKKLGVYARAGAQHAWLVDPIARVLEILIRKGRGWTKQATYRDHDRVRAAPFDAIEIELAFLWKMMPPVGEP